MNLDRIQERLIHLVVLIGGLLFAVLCGMLAGGGQFSRLGTLMVGLGLVALVLTLKARIWLLIPLFWPLLGTIPLTELPFGVRDFAVLIAFSGYLVLMGFKVIRAKAEFDLIDTFVFANALYLVTAFIRNPVGVKAFNSEMVGGKPYFNIFIGCLSYFVLCRVPADFKTVCRLPLFLLPAPAFLALGTLINTYSPALAGKIGLGMIYGDFAPATVVVADDVIGRKAGVMSIGLTGMQVLTSYFRPLSLLLPAHFGRFILAIVFTSAVLLSGFRSALLMVGVYIVFSSYFRHQQKDLLAFAVVGVLGLTFISVGNGRLFDLPLAVQRALSFLPGKWDQTATSDAQRSIEWRVEMWEMVWHEDRWIQNKWLGDGFGFTRRELSLMEGIAAGGEGFLGAAEQEAFMINGVFHHGPLSTIRFVGAAGLVLYYALMVVLATRSVQIINLTFRTRLFPAALFVGMPIVSYALTYPFGIGQFDIDAPNHLFMAGLIKLVGRAAAGLPKPAAEEVSVAAVDLSPATMRTVPTGPGGVLR
jgi:hypothetical protein